MPAARASCWAAVSREGPPLVIAPPAEDLQVARGESLTPEAAAPDEADRVARHESEALAHVAFAGEGHACVRMKTRRPTSTAPRLRTRAYFLRRTTTMMMGCRARSRSWWGLKPKNHWTNSKPPASSTTVLSSCGKTIRER